MARMSVMDLWFHLMSRISGLKRLPSQTGQVT